MGRAAGCRGLRPHQPAGPQQWHPDFVDISFYKMFGYPTGVGALLARHDALAKLQRPWFSGGTIVAAFVQREWYQSAPGPAHFEDGTLNFLNLPAVEIGLRYLEGVGIDAIHSHVQELARSLLGAAPATALSNSDWKPRRKTNQRRVDARWTPKLVLVASADNENS